MKKKKYLKPQVDVAQYGAQNEAYKCLLVENVANDLCFS